MANEIFAKVVELVANQLPVKPEAIKMESRLVEDLSADSANVMILIMDLEEAFELEVDDEALSSIKTIGDIVEYLEKHA